MSERRAPYAKPKPKKPEYEEPPTIEGRTIVDDTPPKQAPVEVEPTRGGIPRETDLPVTHLGQEHDALHYFATKHPPPMERPTIRGRGNIPMPLPKEKPQTDATTPKMGDVKPTTPSQWSNVSLTQSVTQASTMKEDATGYTLLPAEKKKDVDDKAS